MMTDGEVLQVTAGPWAIWAVADMWMLTGSTTWIESQEELDRLLPPYKQWQRRIGFIPSPSVGNGDVRRSPVLLSPPTRDSALA